MAKIKVKKVLDGDTFQGTNEVFYRLAEVNAPEKRKRGYKKEIEKLITITELSKISGIKPNILARYVRQGLLLYKKQSNNLTRYYDKNKALRRLKEIKRLEEEGVTTSEMIVYFGKKDHGKEIKEMFKLYKKYGEVVIYDYAYDALIESIKRGDKKSLIFYLKNFHPKFMKENKL